MSLDRPFIEFVQSQRLPWTSEVVAHVRPHAEVRQLSVDERSGASSLIIRYPAGWERDVEERLTADEEFFVLQGSFEVNGVTYGPYGYGHLPVGYVRSGMRSQQGAVVLTFFDRAPESHTTSSHGEDLSEERLITHINALDGEWGAGFNPKFPPGAGRKWLRRDSVTTDETWILGTMPLRNGFKREKHPVVEEMFLISGELHGPNGVMRPGAYFWRPPEEWHGPFGSLTGNVMLFRTVGGPLSTVYDDNELPFSWFPEDNHILPNDYQQLPPYNPSPCGCF